MSESKSYIIGKLANESEDYLRYMLKQLLERGVAARYVSSHREEMRGLRKLGPGKIMTVGTLESPIQPCLFSLTYEIHEDVNKMSSRPGGFVRGPLGPVTFNSPDIIFDEAVRLFRGYVPVERQTLVVRVRTYEYAFGPRWKCDVCGVPQPKETNHNRFVMDALLLGTEDHPVGNPYAPRPPHDYALFACDGCHDHRELEMTEKMIDIWMKKFDLDGEDVDFDFVRLDQMVPATAR